MYKKVLPLPHIKNIYQMENGIYAKFNTSKGSILVKLTHDLTPGTVGNFVGLAEGQLENTAKPMGKPYYDGLKFHRVIADFMIQGGDPDSKTAKPGAQLGEGDTGYTIPAEFRTPAIYHKKGALAAAREGDNVNPQKASSGCQFYIVEGKTFTDAELDKMQESKTTKYGNIAATNDSTYKFSLQARKDYKTVGGTPHLDGNYTVFGEVIKGLDVVEKISKVKTNASDRPLDDVRIITMKNNR